MCPRHFSRLCKIVCPWDLSLICHIPNPDLFYERLLVMNNLEATKLRWRFISSPEHPGPGHLDKNRTLTKPRRLTMLTGICNGKALGRVHLKSHGTAVKASFTNVARHRRQRQLSVTFSEKHSKSSSSQTSIDTLDLLLSSDEPSPGEQEITPVQGLLHVARSKGWHRCTWRLLLPLSCTSVNMKCLLQRIPLTRLQELL